jgi:hypothetical protein
MLLQTESRVRHAIFDIIVMIKATHQMCRLPKFAVLPSGRQPTDRQAFGRIYAYESYL